MGAGLLDLADLTMKRPVIVCVYGSLRPERPSEDPEVLRALAWRGRAPAWVNLGWDVVTVSGSPAHAQRAWLRLLTPGPTMLADPKFILARRLLLSTETLPGSGRAYHPITFVAHRRRVLHIEPSPGPDDPDAVAGWASRASPRIAVLQQDAQGLRPSVAPLPATSGEGS